MSGSLICYNLPRVCRPKSVGSLCPVSTMMSLCVVCAAWNTPRYSRSMCDNETPGLQGSSANAFRGARLRCPPLRQHHCWLCPRSNRDDIAMQARSEVITLLVLPQWMSYTTVPGRLFRAHWFFKLLRPWIEKLPGSW